MTKKNSKRTKDEQQLEKYVSRNVKKLATLGYQRGVFS